MFRSKCLVRMSGMFVCAWLLSAVAVQAAFTSLAYQGKLTDAAGQPINDQVRMVFRIWNETLSQLVWVETQSVVNVQSGLFNVRLGTTIPLPYHTFIQNYDTPFLLGIQVGNDAEMTPRIPFLSVFSANMAGWASHAASATHATTAGTAGPWLMNGNDMYFDSGNVGIGYIAQNNCKLDVKNPYAPIRMRLLGSGGTQFIIDEISNAMPEIQFQRYGSFRASVGFDQANTNLFLYHDGSVVVHKGRVGIGTLTPTNSLEVHGNVRVTGQCRGTFPRPDYDSGWVAIAQGESKILTHSMGGDAGNYVVDLMGRKGGVITSRGLNGYYYYFTGSGASGYNWGGYWMSSLNNSSVTVYRSSTDRGEVVDDIRVRIWRYN